MSIFTENPLLLSILHHISDGIMLFEKDVTCSYMNQAAMRLLAIDSSTHDRATLANSITLSPYDSIRHALDKIQEDPHPQPITFASTITAFNQKAIAAHVLLYPTADNTILVLQDKSDATELSAKLEYQATHDQLTGLANRTLLYEYIENTLAESIRNTHKFALLFLDLDGFKSINDSLGHYHGDQMLKAVTKRFLSISTPNDTWCRFGGDEFVVVVHQYTHYQELSALSVKVLALFEAPFEINNDAYYMSASIGISQYPKDGKTLNELLKKADSAMYLAKEQGKNKFKFHTANLNEETEHRLFIKNELTKAIKNKQLQLLYQPQIDASTNRMIGAESLLRWEHPERGDIPPSEFIPIAEEYSLMIPLGRFVLEKACQDIVWLNKKCNHPKIAINLSLKEFHANNFSQHVISEIEKYEIDPNQVTLELTESIFIDDLPLVLKTLKKLKSFGVKIALDDFGTGYSCLNILAQLPIDIIKIDKSFVMKLEQTKQSESIIKSIIQLSENLEKTVLAEGVETNTQRQKLLAAGCSLMQGFYFSRPVPKEALAPLLNKPFELNK